MRTLLTDLLTFLCVAAAALLAFRLFAARARGASLRRLGDLLGTHTEVLVPTVKPDNWLPEILMRKFTRAGLNPSRRQALAIVAGLALVLSVTFAMAGVIAGLSAAVTLVLLGWAFLEWRAAARFKLLSDCMLGFLERLRQLLLVGNSLSVALTRATENSPRIMAECMASTLRRIDNGGGVADSLERCAVDLDLYELHLLATAARTNLRFGGSMTATLRNIIENIRKRSSIERELRSNTTQIRASAWVLGLLPILVATVVMLTNRNYSSWFLTNPTGHAMIFYAVASQLLGAWFMRRITRTRY